MADAQSHRKRKFVLALLLADEENTTGRERKIWTREWIGKRKERGAFHQLVQEMLAEDEPAFEKYFRMSKEKFFELVRRREPNITKQDTRMRESIKPEERVAVTLRYLATGETFSSLQTQFRIHRTTISEIVLDVCENVFEVLGKEVLNVPSSTAEWLSLSEKFESRWNFPNGLFAGSSRERRQKN